MTPFVLQLRWLIETKGMKQKQIAKILQVSQAQVSRWLEESRKPSLDTLGRAAKVFGVPIGDLLESPPGAVHESVARYGSEQQASIYMQRLKRRWHHKGAPQAEMQIALRILFGDDTDAILKWLEEE
jgi:transcriptional regulator with XRE-family HTH domain